MTYEPPGGTPPPPPAWQPPPVSAPDPASTYATGGYAYSPTPQVQATKGLATALSLLLALTSLAAIFVVYAFFHRASIVDDLSGATYRDVHDADSTVGGAVALFGIALLGTGVVWIIWQFRHAKNAETLRGNLGLQSGWAIGGWFVPFGNFVLPQLQLYQAASASDPDLPQGQPASAGRGPSMIVGWWVLFDLAWLFFLFGRGTRPGDSELRSFGDLDKFVRADRISGVSAVLWVATGIVAILVVRACTKRQARALAGFTPQPPPAMQWQPPPPPQQQWQAPPPPAPPQWQPPPPPAPPTAPPSQPWPPPPAPPTAPPSQPWPPPPPPTSAPPG